MSDAENADEKPAQTESAWRRRRRLDEVFGDDLPATTGDERGLATGRSRDFYDRNRPPHHG